MSAKTQYIILNILDWAFTWGGSISVIVFNYISKDNSTGFKISITGILLLIALIFTAKAIFEKHYRRELDDLLQTLASSETNDEKAKISKSIEKLKIKNSVYDKIVLLLHFVILYIVSWLGAVSLKSLQGTVGLILVSLTVGSVANIGKKTLTTKVLKEKYSK